MLELPDPSLVRLRCRAAGDGLVLDLGDGRLEPRHLAGAAALAHRHRGRPFRVRVGAEQASYAARMDLGRALEQVGAVHELPPVRGRRVRTELLEVRQLRTSADARSLAHLVHDSVAPIDPLAAEALWECLTELGANVQEHAGSVGYAAAQTLRSTGEVLFAVVDAGAGLQTTLARRGAATDRQGVDLALAGTSRLDRPDRGRGLPTTLELVEELAGGLYLASGTAATSAAGGARRAHVLDQAFPGTLVQGRVRTAGPVGLAAGRRRGDHGGWPTGTGA